MGLFDGLNSLLFPDNNICLFCREKIEVDAPYFLCKDCIDKLEFLNREVNIDSPYLESAVYSLFFNEYIREKIYKYKYYRCSYLYKTFGEILIESIEKVELFQNIDIITFVPIHKQRKAQRGFDQSELMAKYIGESLDIKVSVGNLERTKNTLAQNKLSRSERFQNISGAFKIKDVDEFSNKEVLLIDDIITTGVTLSECGKVLLDSGGKKVYALAITSGKNR